MKFLSVAAITFVALSPLAEANSGPATVILLRGNATTEGGKPLKLKDEVNPGTSVKTEARSFVKLLFKDNSQINVGPDTTLKLEATKAGDPSLVNLVGGQIRAKVTKDLLQGPGESQEKLLIKTKTAAMGIRGTDFNVSFNQTNGATALVTFEGMVAMVKVSGTESAASALAAGVNLQSVGAGQFSGANPTQTQASVPVRISPGQLETLRRNENYDGMGEKSASKAEALASPVPPGVDPKLFASGADSAIASSLGKSPSESGSPAGGPPPEGFFDSKTGAYAPRAGGFIDLGTGLYVPPPPGSSFDPNTGVYVPPRAMGQFDPQTGMYVPPKGVELDPVKGFVAETRAVSPGASPGAPPPPTAMTNLLNFAMRPELAGQQTSFDKLFTPTAGGGSFVPPPPGMLPPLPGLPPPPPPGSLLPPPPPEPIDDPSCPYCTKDSLQPVVPNTSVNFIISVP